jgi:DNA-binding Xre family transcriptional regulator
MKPIVQRYIPQGSILESARSTRKDGMVRLRIHAIMKTRRISAYALSKGTKLSYPSAYRLSRAGGVFGRLHAETLDTLCQFFRVQPGKLLEWVP